MRTVLLLFTTAAMLLAADYSGTYKGEAEVSGGKVQNTLVMKIKAGVVSGTLTNQFGTLSLQDGALEGQDFFFFVVVKDEGEDFRMVYRGHIFEDEIQFRIEAGERQIDLIVKKAATS